MKIDELYIKNFRNIEEETFCFPSLFTVIIGMNGKGKSTLLHALRIAAGAYLLGIPKVNKRGIGSNEIRKTNRRLLLEHRPVIVQATGRFPEKEASITWKRRMLEGGKSVTSSAEDIGLIKELGTSKYRRMQDDESDELDLPLIAYFGTNRVYGVARKRRTRVGRQIFVEGYHEWDSMRLGSYRYKAWLETYDALVEGGKEYPESKQVFFDTIKKACPYITNIALVKDTIWLRVDMLEEESDFLPLDLMSDGIITFVEMVAELVYRCIVLNGYLREKSVINTRGVVLVDEIDLHLHPKWQKHVVSDLKEAFPNVQFIVTTHSPMIVQSLRSEELINLDRSQRASENDPYKYSLEEVADEMGVELARRSKLFMEMQQNASDFFKLVNDARNPSEVRLAKRKLDELRMLFNHDPAYIALLESELSTKPRA